MQITIIGYGRMGKEVEAVAQSKGHQVVLRIDRDNIKDFDSEIFNHSDVAIEFTTPETAFDNISRCIRKGIPVVSGTTGWTGQMEVVNKLVEREGGSFIHSSNFSIGVNILFNLNKRLAAIMNELPGYQVSIEEIHHTMKKDSPSGTAISLAEDIINECHRFKQWNQDDHSTDQTISIRSVRKGQVTGNHRVEWLSGIDTITIEHNANNRQGFALGAVFAAEHIHKRKGVFTMSNLLGF